MQLMFEVTRNCNMQCPHCLRGDTQNLNLKHEYITSFLNQVRELEVSYDVCFTGGEPSLNLEAIKHYISECKRLYMSHERFYIATNGSRLNLEFAGVCLELYAMAGDKETCRVDFSNDNMHDSYNESSIDFFKGLSFFGKKYENKDYNYDNNSNTPLLEGRAKENFPEHPYRRTEVSAPDIENREDVDDTICYLNCKGNIINGCDFSYESQDKSCNILCRVEDFKRYYTSLPEAEYV